jgi:hypothetical protein
VAEVGDFDALTIVFYLTRFVGSAGQVAEWLKAPVSKTGIPFTRYREFESLPVRFDAILARRHVRDAARLFSWVFSTR